MRTQRALGILRILQAGQVWSAAELAAQFNCSTRTIFRDLQLLRECGIPIDSPRGENGFRLSHDFFWQPVRPTLDELIALVLGSRLAGELLPKGMAKDLEAAIDKLVGSERPAVRQRLNELNLRIDSPHPSSPGSLLPEVAYLQPLLEHIVSQTTVRLMLVEGDSIAGLRELIPVRLHCDEGQWMLQATVYEGGPEETILLSRIVQIEPPEKPPGEALRSEIPADEPRPAADEPAASEEDTGG
ncbi:MAG: HTH domain-containing protein [Pirellulaceae bacterium]